MRKAQVNAMATPPKLAGRMRVLQCAPLWGWIAVKIGEKKGR